MTWSAWHFDLRCQAADLVLSRQNSLAGTSKSLELQQAAADFLLEVLKDEPVERKPINPPKELDK